MEVSYELTAADLTAFQWRGVNRSPLVRRSRRNTYIYLFLAFFLMSLVPAIGSRGHIIYLRSFNYLFLLTGFPLTAGLFWMFERRMTRRAIDTLVGEERPDKGRIGRHTIVLDNEGVLERTLVGETRSAWPGIEKVEQDENYLYIYTAPGAAHIIPRHAFRNADEANAFFEYALKNVS
ncbi:MAG TPA: YcxB family protein [Gemmatimonadaceae bacterium]|nr:YcxB family protein [Gemmatimonadaceae bacterium]